MLCIIHLWNSLLQEVNGSNNASGFSKVWRELQSSITSVVIQAKIILFLLHNSYYRGMVYNGWPEISVLCGIAQAGFAFAASLE